MNKFETMYFEMLGECDFEGDEKYIKWLLFVVVSTEKTICQLKLSLNFLIFVMFFLKKLG